MQRRVLEEQVHQKPSVYLRIDTVSRADEIVERCAVGNDDECAGLVFRHSSAGLGDFVGFFACRSCGLDVSAEKSVEELLTFGAAHISVSESDEELSYLRLEDDDQSQHTDIKHHVHDGNHQSHVECSHYHSDHVQRYDGDEDAHCRCSANPPEKDEDDQAEQYYVENVRNGQFKKAEKR